MIANIPKEENEGVSKNWLWMFLGLYVFLILLAICFLFLYAGSYNTRNSLQQQISQLSAANDILAISNNNLTQKIAILDNENLNLNITLDSLNKQNKLLNDTIQKNIVIINDTTQQLSTATIMQDVCFIVGGCSILGNIGLIPYAIMQLNQYNNIEAQLNYLKPRYYLGALGTISTMIMRSLGKLATYIPLYLQNGTFSKQAFFANVTGKSNTTTLILTDSNEIIGFVLHSQWKTDPIIDGKAYTISFRNFMTTTNQRPNDPVFNSSDFIQIGDQEIVVNSTGKGTAKVGSFFKPDAPIGDPNDFYASGGNFNAKAVFSYQWALTG